MRQLLQLSVDSELREVLKTSLPLVLVELVSSLYSLIDTYFISGLGAGALAGLGISMYALMLLQSAIVLFTTPVLIVVSQSVHHLPRLVILAGGSSRYLRAPSPQ